MKPALGRPNAPKEQIREGQGIEPKGHGRCVED